MASPGLQPHLMMMIQTSSSIISSASVLNYSTVFKYGKVLIPKINASIWLWHNLLKDERKYMMQREHTCRNPKRHISLVSLLLWHKMVVVHCFVWGLCLRLWSVRQWDKILSFSSFLKKLFPAISKKISYFYRCISC